MHVLTEQPLGVDQEQLFEEEDFSVVEEGKWSSPLYFVLYNYIIVRFTFIMILH
jgi:hypothetical protein